MAVTDLASTSPSPSSEPDYDELCDLAVELNLALLESDVLKLAAKYLMSMLPSITFARFVHNLSTMTEAVTIRPGGIVERTRSAYAPKSKAASGEGLLGMGPQSPEEGCPPESCSNLPTAADDHKAASIHVSPMQSKGKALGTMTVCSSCPDTFTGRWAEAVDIVAAMVAPYLHIHDLRQHLEIKQTCLLDCLPAQVASHMLEKRAMGMTPVLQGDGNDAASSSSDGQDM